jgi:hypothetical protein
MPGERRWHGSCDVRPETVHLPGGVPSFLMTSPRRNDAGARPPSLRGRLRRRGLLPLLGAGLAVSAAAAACGSSSANDDGSGIPVPGDYAGNGGSCEGNTSGGSLAGFDAGVDALPPETDTTSYGAPVATGKYVWIANPSSGRVAYIDATTLQIKLVEAGDGPTYLAAVPDPTDDVAIVLNVLSLDATVLRASASGLTATTLPVPGSGNTWAVSADGHWAIAWTDARRITNPDPVEGYQDIAVLDLTPGSESSVDLTVGYRPVGVGFDTAGGHAYAVTQDGVSVVTLGQPPAVTKNIPLTSNLVDAGATPQVAITQDGAYALVRTDGLSSIDVVSLADGTPTTVPLPAPPTDLALSADGKTAVAVVRDTSQAALLPIPGIVADPSSLTLVTADALIGSVTLASQSSIGFFYTNALPDPVLTVIDTGAAMPVASSILLRAPVFGVFPSPDAGNVVVLHDALTSIGSQFVAAASLVPVALGLPPKIIGLTAPPISVAVAPDGAHALIAAGDDGTGIYELVVASMPSLDVQILPLASLPIAAGVVAGANRGYVAQTYPDGRITFIDFATGEARTLTGFELATEVVDDP